MKGITPIIGTTLLLVIIIGIGIGVQLWSQKSVKKVGEESKNKTAEEIKALRSSFYIEEVYPVQKKIQIKNSGEVPLPVDRFAVFLNNSKTDFNHNCGSELQIRERCNITVTENIGNYFIRIIGEYGTWDEYS